MRGISIIGLTAAVALPLLAACESAPRVRNVEMGPVDTGGGSVESVRRQLHGNWELVTLDLVGAGGVKTPVEANARLQYDDYGNMSIRGSITGSQQIDPSVLNLTGQVEIDPVGHVLRFRRIEAKSADERRVDPKLDASQLRYYEFAGNILTTTIKDAAGAPTAIATWKKID